MFSVIYVKHLIAGHDLVRYATACGINAATYIGDPLSSTILLTAVLSMMVILVF